MRTIDDLLDEIREKVYSGVFEAKEILNERYFAISRPIPELAPVINAFIKSSPNYIIHYC